MGLNDDQRRYDSPHVVCDRFLEVPKVTSSDVPPPFPIHIIHSISNQALLLSPQTGNHLNLYPLRNINVEATVPQVLNRRVPSISNNIISVSIAINISKVDVVVSTSTSRGTVSRRSDRSELPVRHITASRLQVQEDTSRTTGPVELHVIGTTVRVNINDLSVDSVDDATVQRRRNDTLILPGNDAVLELVEPDAEGTVGGSVNVVGSSVTVEVLELDADTGDTEGGDGERVAVEVNRDLRVNSGFAAGVCVDGGGAVGVEDNVFGAVVGVDVGETDLRW